MTKSIDNSNELTPEAANKILYPYLSTLFWCLREGVVFIDRDYHVGAWSQAVESITGRSAAEAIGSVISPSLMCLHLPNGQPVPAVDCPVAACMQSGKIRNADYRIVGPSGREIKIELSVTPVIDDNVVVGAVALIYDSSVQLDLQRQLKDLYATSVVDPLTEVANRAEFERVLAQTIVNCKQAEDFNASLIICDIDYFKSINDNFNHHIGDLALVSFAKTLKEHVRAQDLVCRYGGEEFVILCAQCDLDQAVEKAEQIRTALGVQPQQMLGGKCITASFGVTQLHSDDSATDFFVRADSAMLKAKETGRNKVVAANNNGEEATSIAHGSLTGVKWKPEGSKTLIAEEFVTQTPVAVLGEKLRGFILEFDADIRGVSADFASLEVEIEDRKNYSRRGRFRVSFEFCGTDQIGEQGVSRKKNFIKITISEGRRRNWFAPNCNDLAPTLLREIRKYMMLSEDSCKVRVEAAGTASPGRE